jgi:hypothetical protein
MLLISLTFVCTCVRWQCTLQLLYFMTDKSTKCGVDICTYYPEVTHNLYILNLIRGMQRQYTSNLLQR